MTISIGFVNVSASTDGVHLITAFDRGGHALKPDEARALAAVLERMATESERLAAEEEDDEVTGRRCKVCETEAWGIGSTSDECKLDKHGLHDWQDGVTVSKKKIRERRRLRQY